MLTERLEPPDDELDEAELWPFPFDVDRTRTELRDEPLARALIAAPRSRTSVTSVRPSAKMRVCTQVPCGAAATAATASAMLMARCGGGANRPHCR